ncbi:MAG: type I polyketide synthase [Bacteroidales bacterium]|nr:type I polyketide synthase [Bacteroidales bacterium]
MSEAHSAVFAERYDEHTSVQNKTIKSNGQQIITEVAPPKLISRFARKSIPTDVVENETDPIAIVGVSGCFPGAGNIDEFWKVLDEGKHCIQEIPPTRWDWQALYGDPHREDNKTNIKWGGFMEGVDEFDPQFFGISPSEAPFMDPLHRLMMTYIWSVLEDAGHSASSLSDSNTGIFIGTGMSGYSDLFTNSNISSNGFTPSGVISSMGPNRMSYFLNFHGPSEPIETACSSSLVAINRAISSIENGTCDQAIVGGVNIIVTPGAHIAFNKAGLLCEDGRCKTFSKHANGYVRGEGIGMLFLRKLKAAEADNDHIYGLIRGGSENHGGRASSLTAPSPKAQSDVIINAYKKAGIDPSTISYIEAHGTGTALGDSVEITGLKNAFNALSTEIGKSKVQHAQCGLGSVKSNIGHLEFASGVVGVIKVLLQLKHKRLAKSLYSEELSTYIDLKDSPLYIVQQAREWQALQDNQGNALPRRAGVSSFGFGGVNAHIILEEYLPGTKKKQTMHVAVDPTNPVVIVLSAKNKERLMEYALNLLQFIKDQPQINLNDLAYTLQIGRNQMNERLGFVAHSLKEMQEKLTAFTQDEKQPGIYVGQAVRKLESLGVYGTDEDIRNSTDHWFANKT